MSRPADENELIEILGSCLERLQAGETMDQVLADRPDHAEELRTLLEAALAVRSASAAIPTPASGAMQRSRARLLAAAKARKSPGRAWIPSGLFRTRAGLALLAGLSAVFALLFTGLATAQALPGEALYPLKIAAEKVELRFAPNPASRLRWEETYDLRRKQEVQALIKQGREEEVSFTGFLDRQADGSWWIDEIQVRMPFELTVKAIQMEDRYVTVQAVLFPDGELVANGIQPRIYQVTGQITAREGESVSVGGVEVHIGAGASQVDALPPGQIVRAEVIRMHENRLVALQIEQIGTAGGKGNNGAPPGLLRKQTSQPSDSSDLTPTPSPDPTGEKDGKDTPNGKGNPNPPGLEKTKKAPPGQLNTK